MIGNSFGKACRLRQAFFILACLIAGGCADGSLLDSRQDTADRIARTAGLAPNRPHSGAFELLAYSRYDAPDAATLTVYIEGDGLAWNAFGTAPSKDPTPSDPVALRLAAIDPAPNRLYLARPCQYQVPVALARCSYVYWTSHRFAEEVIAAMTDIVRREADALAARRIRLIGYSGGGAVAALIAVRLPGRVELITLAAPLDHAYWTQRMNVSPMTGSLNPVDYAGRLATVPQAHIVSSRDAVVPPDVVEHYIAAITAAGGSARLVSTDKTDHWCCWPALWRPLLDDLIPLTG